MEYIPTIDAERDAMLHTIGVQDIDTLFADIPSAVRLRESLHVPQGSAEQDVLSQMRQIAAENTIFRAIFRGAGAYSHYIPAVVDAIASKEEFVTAYTPYQPEMSQGVLQSIFEYQTMICRLTGMDVSNASVYDGATAAAEAAAMCVDKKKHTVCISEAVNPRVAETVRTYCFGSDTPTASIPAPQGHTTTDAIAALPADTACILVQQPNYFGQIEDLPALCNAAHAQGIKVIVSANPIAMALLETPGECDADIAVGDAQPLGMPLSYGGPYLGFMASTAAMMRKLPGRIVGQTTDAQGNRMFVLTLQAREQHIRREKASSNICSNQAHCALRALAYMSAMGSSGLTDVARQCTSKAHYMAQALSAIPGIRFYGAGDFFHEFVTATPADEAVLAALEKRGILGGMMTEHGILWCVTEQNSKLQIDEAVSIIKEVCATCN